VNHHLAGKGHPLTLADNLTTVRARIQAACQRAGRDPGEITLVAVSKTWPAEAVMEARALGLIHFGENRIQEAELKIPKVAELSAAADLNPTAAAAPNPTTRTDPPIWHLIGHLQSNKANKAVDLFDLIHTIDSATLANAIAKRAKATGKQQRVLIQVNCSGEHQKSGCQPGEAKALAEQVVTHPELLLEGLMTIGPISDDPESARAAFQQCRAKRDEIGESLNLTLPHLSMGMTNDLEVAIEEGATLIRVGSALFGHRQAP